MFGKQKQEMMVYVIMGFLEAGKTSLIRDLLVDELFDDKSKTLILVCEEGEEEYPQALLNQTHAACEYIEDEESFNGKVIEKFLKKHRPDRIIIEYNGINHIYGDTLVEPEILLPDNAACLRLPGTDGKAKMSKSLGNCIYLSDTADEVEKKVKSMYTDPTHLKVSDPGKLEGNTVFTYLDAFCKPEHFGRYLPDYPNLDELKAHYTRGGLGDMKVKKFLAAIMQEELTPIRERRKEFEKDIPAIYDMLRKGCETARATATATLDEVRKAMKINYFDDVELIAEQAKRFGQE